MMVENDSSSRDNTWHIADWPPLAWLETVIKLFALLLAILTGYRALQYWSFNFPSGIRLIEWILMLILSLGLTAAILDRIQNREIIAMSFILLNNLGHWGMTYALMTEPGPGSLLLVFTSLMLLGDLVKLLFLRLHSYTVKGLSKSVMYGLTAIYIAGYAAIFLLEIFL